LALDCFFGVTITTTFGVVRIVRYVPLGREAETRGAVGGGRGNAKRKMQNAKVREEMGRDGGNGK
jgi:hypothetical protein